mmetsp:Transcript_2322/g.5901  ORF Transcript_2322/g.5901 Transcript_2322/m.5901 type:complete len:81 (+) Transcript_2322:199-441(+)
MRSALRTVLRRCATTMQVRLPVAMILSSVCCTSDSLSASRAEVASSRSRMSPERTSARAMAMRCFWPPERVTPRSPHLVS